MFSYLARVFLIAFLFAGFQPAFAHNARLPGTLTPQEIARQQSAQKSNSQQTNNTAYDEAENKTLEIAVTKQIALYTRALAYLTGALVIATIFLFVANWRTANAAKKSADVAESALRDLERSLVTVEIVAPGISVDSNGRATTVGQRFKYQCINYGNSAVSLIARNTRTPILDSGNWPDPIIPEIEQARHFPPGIFIARDAPFQEEERPITIYDSRTFDVSVFEQKSQFFIGYVVYMDAFRDTYVHGFCFVFDPYECRYIRGGDDRYNYTRKYDTDEASQPRRST